jgi:quercetin dioxygenase-like cupin family protein
MAPFEHRLTNRGARDAFRVTRCSTSMGADDASEQTRMEPVSRLRILAAFAAATFAHPTHTAPVEGYILGPGDGQVAMSHVIKADPVLGSKRLGLGTQVIATGSGIEFHAHGLEDEILYVVRGRGIGAVGTAKAPLLPGSLIYAPAGAWHAIHAEEEMEVMWISSPPEFSNYLRDLHAAKQAGELDENRWGNIAESHNFRNGRGFLEQFLGGTEWHGDVAPWTRLRFEKSGVVASSGVPEGPTNVEFVDPSADGLGFLGRWRKAGSDAPEDIVLYFDPNDPDALRIVWGPKLSHTTILHRRR